MMRPWVVFLCVSIYCGTTSALINSVERLVHAMKDEEKTLKNLKETLIDIQKELAIIEEYVDSYDNILEDGLDLFKFVSHPVNGYKVMNRMVKGWEGIQRAKDSIKEKLDEDGSTLKSCPNQEELDVTAMSLMNLQIIYEQEARDMSEGVILDYRNEKAYESPMKMSAEECVHIGDVASDYDDMDVAIDWYEAALVKIEEGDETVDEKYMWKLLDKAVQKHDEILEKRGPMGEDWRTYGIPFDPELAKNKKYGNKIFNNDFEIKLYQDHDIEECKQHTFRLCRGEKMLSEEVTSVLRCRHVTNNDPYLSLMPLKLEEYSLDPYIVVFHEFITDKEIEEVIELSKEELAPSLVFVDNATDVRSVGVTRTSDNAWLFNDPITVPISRKIATATKLEVIPMSSSEPYQIANYGIGGQYFSHHDYMQTYEGFNDTPSGMMIGDRLATFMTYLSDVDAGGATVFPRAGVTIWPKKGSAAFWWNLYKNAEADPNTTHGGCPVLHGSKWIANKWVRVYDQMFKAPCEAKRLRKFTHKFLDYGCK